MVQWLIRHCFTNLELESQKNRLLLFMLVPLFLFAELDITINAPFTDPANLQFILYYLILFGCSFILIFFPAAEKAYKYIVISGMLIFSMYELWLFQDYPIIYQIMYINLGLALIYLNGYLIMYTGIATAVLTAVGFLFWQNVFFPNIDEKLINVPIILILQMTVVLWGVTKIGVRFKDYIDYNQTMKQLLQENEQQLQLIHENNKSLAEYAKQIEQFAILEERNRLARELHDTMGHTLTSMIAGLELMKHTKHTQDEVGVNKIDALLHTARDGLEEVRNHVRIVSKTEPDEELSVSIRRLASEFAENAGIHVQIQIEGKTQELPTQHRLTLLRCTQETLTNAVRHGKADRIRIRLRYEADEVLLDIENNGEGTDTIVYGFGLQAMQARIEALKGTLYVSPGLDRGITVMCRLPMKAPVSEAGIRVLLVEDQELIAESFHILLDMEPDLHVTGIAKNGQEALERCEEDLPDVILMDIHMPIMKGTDATRMIKERWPQVKVVMLTTFQDVKTAAEAISYGAEGYLLKSVQPKHLAETIRIVYAGGTLISMETAKLLVDERITAVQAMDPVDLQASEMPDEKAVKLYDPSSDNLNDREIEILRYLAEGFKYKEIAARMHYSEGTVKNYVSLIYTKLSVENRMQAVKKAQESKAI
jgi:DNA-binding NarL/FixJ family response regulator/signal transduction histidine kinase